MKDDSIIYQDRHAWLVAILDNFHYSDCLSSAFFTPECWRGDRGTR